MTLIRFCIVNPVGLCVNNSPDSGIIEQSSITGIAILNSRCHNSYTALNLLSTNSTFPQLFDTWVACHQISTRSKCSVHLFMEAYLTSRCFSIQVDFLLYIYAMTFFCLCIGTHQNDMLIEKWVRKLQELTCNGTSLIAGFVHKSGLDPNWVTGNWVGHYQELRRKGASLILGLR